MYLVNASRSQGGVSIVCPTASKAIEKLRELREQGLAAKVLDDRGREVPIERLHSAAADDARNANRGQV